MLSEELRAEITDLIGRYERPRSALMPGFWAIQRTYGYLPKDAVAEVAELVGVDPGYASGVASFYSMYHLEPVGRYIIQVCRTLSCRMAGAEDILNHLRDSLGVDVGQTTPDGKFTLMTAECLASCGTAPAMLINEDLYESLTPERVDEILARLDG